MIHPLIGSVAVDSSYAPFVYYFGQTRSGFEKRDFFLIYTTLSTVENLLFYFAAKFDAQIT